jgi:hypothetical protein
MVLAVHRICHMDYQDLAGAMFHLPIATTSIFRHNRCYRGGGQACSAIEATSCTNCLWQSSSIHTLQQIFSSLHLSTLCTY